MNKLPEDYLSMMKELLKEGYEDYLASFEEERNFGLRVNTSKISVEDFLKICPFQIEKIPWTQDGFYYKEEERPAKHPYYFAGLYYLQEASAMLPAQVLPIEEGDLVLDACAAPGGKSSKLANKLNKTGVLVANDISVSRAQVLLKTLENQGVENAYVMAEDIAELHQFHESFDKILIDAPCSGQGMFRKDSDLIRSFTEKGSETYVPLQKKIIEAAVDMLKPGGKMVYSTCTFDPKEDEEIIEYALDLCKDLKVLPIEKCVGFCEGITPATKDCVRLYPHRIKGEGHFVALLEKQGEKRKTSLHVSAPDKKLLDLIPDEFHGSLPDGDLVLRKDRLYVLPPYDFPSGNARILRSGLLVGELKHGRFRPSQALAMTMSPVKYGKILDLSLEDERVLKYLKCETLKVDDVSLEGTLLVCVDHFPLGFGEVKNGILKNRYPVHYRYQ
ncbi:MAG: RsmB/NOP family class I SAM-dependent RNA methyltransferase [Erysipelotrichaceae bacterium]|nr:RsmB/NOP family class I SAM-dependent RNA methyltransferase [Erysipelotrichaceae bacterium]